MSFLLSFFFSCVVTRVYIVLYTICLISSFSFGSVFVFTVVMSFFFSSLVPLLLLGPTPLPVPTAISFVSCLLLLRPCRRPPLGVIPLFVCISCSLLAPSSFWCPSLSSFVSHLPTETRFLTSPRLHTTSPPPHTLYRLGWRRLATTL